MTGVLAVFAHPDDESLLAGGMLAACASVGMEVRVVSMTRGELGPVTEIGELPAGGLAAARSAELAEAARALGIAGAECLALPDGELADVEPRDAIDPVVERIESLQPDTVITFGPEGLYWHPDHIAVHGFVASAVEAAEGRLAEPSLFAATWPEGRAARLVDEMRRRGLPADLWGLDPRAFGAPERGLTSLDVRPLLPRKLRALESYRTQIGPHHVLANLPHDLAEEYLGREYLLPLRAAAGHEGSIAAAVRGAARAG